MASERNRLVCVHVLQRNNLAATIAFSQWRLLRQRRRFLAWSTERMRLKCVDARSEARTGNRNVTFR